MYVRCVFLQYAAVCHYRRLVCVSGAPARVRHTYKPVNPIMFIRRSFHLNDV